MASANDLFTGSLLIGAGAFQWTPLKETCLKNCRSTIGFLMTEWRDGPGGAFVMGSRHGIYCVGCCWALMAALFAFGVMNLVWVALIAILVLVEKTAPLGRIGARGAGIIFIAAGIWIAAR